MGRGVNVLGYDGIWEGGVDAPFKERYFKMIRDAGFGHVRINLHGFTYMDRDNRLPGSVLERLDRVFERAIDAGLVPVLDEHDFHTCQSDPEGCSVKVAAFWTQLAERYAGRYPSAVFELLNEPGGRMTADRWNGFYPGLIAAIRKRDPSRTIVVAAINSDDPNEVKRLRLPPEDRNLIVTVHYYKPIEFTHQGAPWSRKFSRLHDISWGTPADLEEVSRHFALIDAWAKAERRPVYLGEFGVYERAPADSRTRWLAAVRGTAERFGWPWAYWQFDHDFALYDPAAEQWNRPILDALIPPDRRSSKR